jgi:hypothetical protein
MIAIASSAATFLPQKFSHEQLRLIVDLYDEDTAFCADPFIRTQ